MDLEIANYPPSLWLNVFFSEHMAEGYSSRYPLSSDIGMTNALAVNTTTTSHTHSPNDLAIRAHIVHPSNARWAAVS